MTRNRTSSRKAKPTGNAAISVSGKPDSAPQSRSTKLDLLIEQLSQPNGATIQELVEVTGWQAHSVRGAIAGALRKKGYAITSAKIDGVRRYSIRVLASVSAGKPA